jgi:hypothetical protein
MPVQVLGVDGNPFDENSIEVIPGRFLRTYVLLKLSGNYPAGGDIFDITNAGGTALAPNATPQAVSRGLVSIDIRPLSKLTSSFSAAAGQYFIVYPSGVIPIPFASLNTLKLKLMLDIATEYNAGAYGADALGDVIIAELTWAR